MKNILTFVFLIASLLGCAKMGSPAQNPALQNQVDFSFTLEGEQHFLSELRGRPVVLVLMRTSEISSQAYMQQVREAFASVAGVTRFLVLTVEPSEAPFVQAYTEFEQLPFKVGVAQPELRIGNTSLGAIPGIPCTYIIDSNGCVVDGAVGVVKADVIVDAVKALERT